MNQADLKKHLKDGVREFALCSTSSYDAWKAMRAEVVGQTERLAYGRTKKCWEVKILEVPGGNAGVRDVAQVSIVNYRAEPPVGKTFYVESGYISQPWSTYLQARQEHERKKNDAEASRLKQVSDALEAEIVMCALGMRDREHFTLNRRAGQFSFRGSDLLRLLDRIAEEAKKP
jgi:hypothetical protein